MYEELDKFIGNDKGITYKQICNETGLNYTTGKAKIIQIEDINRYFEINKVKTKYFIIKRREIPIIKIDHRSEGNSGVKYHWLKNERFKKHGVYYIVDNDLNMYIGSTSVTFANRYRGHMCNGNGTEAKTIVRIEHWFDILYDMTEIEDDELIRLIENEFINYFKYNTQFNILNNRSITKNKTKYIKVKINEKRIYDVITFMERNNIDFKL